MSHVSPPDDCHPIARVQILRKTLRVSIFRTKEVTLRFCFHIYAYMNKCGSGQEWRRGYDEALGKMFASWRLPIGTFKKEEKKSSGGTEHEKKEEDWSKEERGN